MKIRWSISDPTPQALFDYVFHGHKDGDAIFIRDGIEYVNVHYFLKEHRRAKDLSDRLASAAKALEVAPTLASHHEILNLCKSVRERLLDGDAD